MTIPESLKRSRLAFQVLEDGEYIPHPVPSSCFSLFVAFPLLDLLPFPISDDLVTVEGMFLLVAVVIDNVTDEALDGVFMHLLAYGFDVDCEELKPFLAKSKKDTEADIVRIFAKRDVKKLINAIHEAGGIAVLARRERHPPRSYRGRKPEAAMQ